LDIVHDAVEDIKLGEGRLFSEQQDNAKMDNETKNADNDRTFKYIKLLVDNSSIISGGLFTTITSAIVNIWRVMMIWSKPFAGLVILVVFIIFIILIFFGEDDSSSSANSGGVGTGSMVGSGKFNFFSNMGGGSNNNTDIISVLQRMPQNIYAFIDKLSMAYSRFSNYVSTSSDLISNLSDTTPIITDRTEKGTGGTGGLYDNIYTFDYKYIDSIKEGNNITANISSSDLATINSADTHVYNIKKPKKSDNNKMSDYYNISHNDTFDKIGDSAKNEYIYAPKCGTNNNNDYVFDDCTIKNINDCGEAVNEDTSDYKNIII
jgi:hypothetical protein